MPSSDPAAAPRVSVVVVTRDNADLLRDALASILADSSGVERELIVVDNGSSDGTTEVAAAAAAGAPFPVTLLHEPEPGLSRGRNRGVAAARGEIVLFTDDDVLVEDGWADALAAAFADPAVGVAGGRTLPIWPHPPAAWLDGPHRVSLALFDHGEESRLLADDEALAGANLALRASLLGPDPFRLDIGNTGDRRFGYEETALVDALRREHAAVYVGSAVVHHRIRAERMTLRWLRATYFDQGIAVLRLRERAGEAESPGLARRLVRALRVARKTLRLRRRHDREGRGPSELWTELQEYKALGRHVDLLLRRFPSLSRWVRDAVV